MNKCQRNINFQSLKHYIDPCLNADICFGPQTFERTVMDRSIVTKMLIIIHTHIHMTSLAIVKNRFICKVQSKHLYLAIPTERGLSTLYTLLVYKVLVAPY